MPFENLLRECLMTNPQTSLYGMLFEYSVLWDTINFRPFPLIPDSGNDSNTQIALELQFTLEKPF